MQKENYITAVKITLIVGTILNFVNNYNPICKEGFTAILIFKIVFTYCVPFSVSLYSAYKSKKSTK
jgi:hypothetical protein